MYGPREHYFAASMAAFVAKQRFADQVYMGGRGILFFTASIFVMSICMLSYLDTRSMEITRVGAWALQRHGNDGMWHSTT